MYIEFVDGSVSFGAWTEDGDRDRSRDGDRGRIRDGDLASWKLVLGLLKPSMAQ
jgi:hypothetical protein